MKYKGKLFTLMLALIATAGAGSRVLGQNQQTPPEHQPAGQLGDPIRQLNLTPDQLVQIRTIRQQTNVERANVNRRVVEANRALEAALDTDTPDESAVEQRVRELSAAQAESMRMRISTEVKIRRVLTLEQRVLLRTLRQQAQELRRDRMDGRNERQRRRHERVNTLRNQRNFTSPLAPGRDVLPRP